MAGTDVPQGANVEPAVEPFQQVDQGRHVSSDQVANSWWTIWWRSALRISAFPTDHDEGPEVKELDDGPVG